MRKKLLCILIIGISHFSFAQSWVDIGLKGGYGLDFVINKNITEDETHTPKFSFGYMYGGKIGWNFNEDHAITIDVLYSGFGSTYEYFVNNADSSKSFYNKDYLMNSLDFLLMYRHVKNSSYVEIGPQYSLVQKGVGKDSNPASTMNGDIKNNFVSTYFSGVIGAGALLGGTENFRVTLGFRVLYTFNDIISKVGKSADFPTGNLYSTYQKSNPLSAMLVMELNYDLGFMASSNCKKRKTSFLLFKN